MKSPKEILDRILNALPSDREEVVEDEFPEEVLSPHFEQKLSSARLLGYGVQEVFIDDRTVSATIFLMYIGEAYSDPEGDYQDEDGDNYDYPEREYLMQVTITDDRIYYELQ